MFGAMAFYMLFGYCFVFNTWATLSRGITEDGFWEFIGIILSPVWLAGPVVVLYFGGIVPLLVGTGIPYAFWIWISIRYKKWGCQYDNQEASEEEYAIAEKGKF